MTGRNDTEENRATAAKAATEQTEALEAIEHFDDIESIYVRGFQDGSIWLADYIEPSRGHVSVAALTVTWQTLVLFRDIALKEADFERVSYMSAAIMDMAVMIEGQGMALPEIHDDTEKDNEVVDEDFDDDSDGDFDGDVSDEEAEAARG
ncbi:hypothetical protein HOT31_gp138 [Microbacterium phage Hendrix]|uniref:Uncharacterized protein n=1 Tax=Microbacterium phage Hendrix TaxID=2182341 RepID=A0A2U8UUG1_9CAUD|nr:hypothetical protein HOT31_gp138 [Microbacterium phage Hendrix]AWN07808.1 hypothetical protein PBI_HENDRIX_137 [Microbacterium phage Hendrix]